MLTLMTSVLATALLIQPANSVTFSGVVVDAAGKPLPDVEVVLWARIIPNGTAPTLARTTSNVQGAFRFEAGRQPLPGLAPRRFIFAYPPDRSVAAQVVDLTGAAAPPPIRLTVAEPLRRTLTILGPDDRPLAGVRLAPILCSFDGSALFQMPDDQRDRLMITSGAFGVATFPYFPSAIDPITVRVAAPGVASHDLPLVDRPVRDRMTLKLGRPARLAGSVYNDSGQPASEVPIEVWVENTYQLPGDSAASRLPSPSLIRFDSGLVRTRADGSFETPQQLLTGSSYRIASRTDPARVLEKHPFENASNESSIRKMVATELLPTDHLAAESIVKALANADTRSRAYVELAEALPDEERAQKRKLLESATVEAHVPAAVGRSSESRRAELGQVARAWLNLADVDRACPLIREGLDLLAVLPKMPQRDDRFLSTAARIEPVRVSSLIQNLSSGSTNARLTTPGSLKHWRSSILPKQSEYTISPMIRPRHQCKSCPESPSSYGFAPVRGSDGTQVRQPRA